MRPPDAKAGYTPTYIPNDNVVVTVIVDNNTIKEVEEFTYSGSIINSKEGVGADIRSRINKASATFAILNRGVQAFYFEGGKIFLRGG